MKLIYTESDLLQKIQEQDKKIMLYLYGAGKVGNIVLQRLKRHHVPVKGFIESQPRNERVQGIPVVSLDEISQERETIIVISTAESLHEEIAARLGERWNVFAISNKLACNMQRIINRRLHFETHLVEHCNLNCRGCYHFSPLAKEEFLSLNEFAMDIERLGMLFHGQMESITLLGGEPLLHPQAAEFFRVVRRFFHEGIIKILTNGLLLLHVSKDFYDAINETGAELWVTKYAVNFDYDHAEDFLKKAYGVELHYFNSEPVRTTGHQPLDISGSQDAIHNFNHCYRANGCVDLKHGKLYPCIIPAEIKPFCEYFNVDISVTEKDYVDIYKVKSAEELLERMETPIPFCRYCNREAVKVFGDRPWGRTAYHIEEWTK